MKRKVGFVLVVVLAVTMCWGVSFIFPSQSQARSVVPVEGSKFDLTVTLADNLKNYMGKDVVVHLKSGTTLQGYVKAVGNGLVHLEKLKGKDFYDALIRIEEISAIEGKFREMK
jgi:hypothetical protein